jgi:hypothetical protein
VTATREMLGAAESLHVSGPQMPVSLHREGRLASAAASSSRATWPSSSVSCVFDRQVLTAEGVQLMQRAQLLCVLRSAVPARQVQRCETADAQKGSKGNVIAGMGRPLTAHFTRSSSSSSSSSSECRVAMRASGVNDRLRVHR